MRIKKYSLRIDNQTQYIHSAFWKLFSKDINTVFFLNNVIPGNYIFQTLSVRIMPWFILQSQQNILETFYTAKGDMQCMANANMRINSK